MISRAKITAPRVSAFFPRKRLFRALEVTGDSPVTWVCGPAGSGKTTLVASYLQTRNLPSLWYRMDEGDGDLATFFYYLGLAGKKAVPGFRKPLPLLTPEYRQGIPVFALRFFEELFGRLAEGTVLVFDNYHSVAEHSLFHEIIGKAFGAIPEGITVIVISRHDYPGSLACLYANGQMSVVGWDDLRLTPEETAGILRLKEPNLRPEEMEDLHLAADGWIAGLVLMLESKRRQISHPSPGKLSREEIINYFGSQFFAGLDLELQEFLLTTAFLPRMTVQTARDLTGFAHAADILMRLTRNNDFTERDHSSKPVYRYHQLMREFLMARARAEMAPQAVASLLAKSAHLLESSGDIEDAAELLIHAARWKDLARLVQTHGPALTAQGRSGVLETWLAAMPPGMVNGSPWLLYWKATSLMTQGPLRSTECFEKAFRLFEAQNDVTGTFLAWSGAVDSILFAWDNFGPLASWFAWIENRLRNHPEFPSPEVEARVAASVVGIFTWALPSRPDVKEWLDRVLIRSQEIGDAGLQLQALSYSLTYFFWRGDIANMQPLVERARAMALSHPRTPLSLISWKITEMRPKLFLPSEYASSLDLAKEAIELAEKSGIHIHDCFIYALAASAALSIDDLALAEEFQHKMEAAAPTTPRAMSNLSPYIAGWLNFLQGNFYYALAFAANALQVSLECVTPIPEILIRQLIAKIRHATGEREAAMREVETTKEVIAKMGNSPLLLYFSLLDEAQFLFDAGEEPGGIEALRSALKIGRAHRYMTRMLHWQPALFARLCARALEQGIEVGYVRDLIRTLNLVPDTPPFDIEPWPWPVRIHVLGRFALQRDGVAIEYSRKARKKPLDLLKVLIALGGKDVREEAIADILWPETPGDAAHHAFEVNLQRLRALLGYPQALQLRSGRLTLDGRYCWVDLWAFEHYLIQVRKEKKVRAAVPAAGRAMQVYAGHFLAGEPEEAWMLSMRERTRSRFLELVQWMGVQYEADGCPQEALDCYRKGLEVDDLAEEFYRRAMKCHLHLGQKSEALSMYARCSRTLSIVLGITPSPETVKLYKRIKENFVTTSNL